MDPDFPEKLFEDSEEKDVATPTSTRSPFDVFVERAEKIFRVLNLATRPTFLLIVLIVTFVAKYVIEKQADARHTAQLDMELSKPWLEEALRILRAHTSSNQNPEESPSVMLNWAIDVFKKYSPDGVEVSEPLEQALREGGLKFSHYEWRIERLEVPVEIGITPGTDETSEEFVECQIPERFKGKELSSGIILGALTQEQILKAFNEIEIMEEKRGATLQRAIRIRYVRKKEYSLAEPMKLLCILSFKMEIEPKWERRFQIAGTTSRGYDYTGYDYSDYSYNTHNYNDYENYGTGVGSASSYFFPSSSNIYSSYTPNYEELDPDPVKRAERSRESFLMRWIEAKRRLDGPSKNEKSTGDVQR